jgi:hypothetical protein
MLRQPPAHLHRMYATCTFCYSALGTNDVLETFGVSRRVAFDPAKGCLWAICPSCARWNLAPLEERWEIVEDCERRFRATTLRYSSGNIGLAWIVGDIELIRVGPALRPEVAAWRYGRVLVRRQSLGSGLIQAAAGATSRALDALTRSRGAGGRDVRAAVARLRGKVRGGRVMDLVRLPVGGGGVIVSSVHGVSDGSEAMDVPLAVVRFRHLAQAALVRPAPWRPWSLQIAHDHGVLTVEGDEGLRTAARLLAIINRTGHAGGFSRETLEAAARKVDESAHTDSYFNRVLAIALRSDWGRGREGTPKDDEGDAEVVSLEGGSSDVERLALRLTGRTFWGQGGIGSEPRTALLDLPLVDRLALEMAAHEETERRALEGELGALEAAWREADEIATIADALLDP